jgi:hypothetical protein
MAFGFVQNADAKHIGISAESEIIVVVTGARLRDAPSLKSQVIGSSKIGTVFSVVSKSGDWYQVSLSNGRTAWISGTIVEDFTEARSGLIYQEIADKYVKRKDLDFSTASEVFGFLTMARNKVENKNVQAVLELQRLRMLHFALEAIPIEKARPWEENEVSVYKDFTNVNKDEIAYSEPAGQWFVNSQSLWDLREKYNDLPIADDIAWEAANTPIPGECEGFVGCHLPLLVMTYGEYLKFYPNGKYSKQVLDGVISNLNSMAGNDGSSYESVVDVEREGFDKAINELRSIISKVKSSERQKALNLLKQVEKKYK